MASSIWRVSSSLRALMPLMRSSARAAFFAGGAESFHSALSCNASFKGSAFRRCQLVARFLLSVFGLGYFRQEGAAFVSDLIGSFAQLFTLLLGLGQARIKRSDLGVCILCARYPT